MLESLDENGEFSIGGMKVVLSSNEEYWAALAKSEGITYEEAVELDKANIENFFKNQLQSRGVIAHDSYNFNAVNAATLICEKDVAGMGVEFGCRLRIFISGTGGAFVDGSITDEYAVPCDTGYYDFNASYADAYFESDKKVSMSTRGTFVITENHALSLGIDVADIISAGGSVSADMKYRLTKTFSDSATLR